MESKDWSGFGYFSPDFSPGIPGRCIKSFEALPAIQRNPRVQVKFVLVRSFWSRYGKNKKSYRNVLHIGTLSETLEMR